jgi:trk system potassium uptake protein TrkH
LGFYLFYIFIFVITSVIYSITGLDLETSLTAAASAIGNIGPGLGSIGPSNNWDHLTDFAKWVTSFTMLMGRLEIFTVVVLFSRSFWRK